MDFPRFIGQRSRKPGEVQRVVLDKLDRGRLDGLVMIGVDEVSYASEHRFLTCLADHSSGGVRSKLVRTIRKHKTGVRAAIELGISNGRLEALNSTVRLISHRAYSVGRTSPPPPHASGSMSRAGSRASGSGRWRTRCPRERP